MTLHVIFPNELLPALDLLDRELVTRLVVQGFQGPHTTGVASPATSPTERGGRNGGDGEGEVVGGARESSPGIDRDPAAAATEAASSRPSTPHQPQMQPTRSIYYVRSAQQASSSSSSASHSKRYRDPVASSAHYEVRPLAWSCSCPAFAFAAFPSVAWPSRTSTPTPKQQGNPGVFTDGLGTEGQDARKGGERRWGVGGLSLGQGMPVCKHLLACTLVECAGLFKGFCTEKVVTMEEAMGWAAGWGG